ncbi:MAG: hypothetical protein K0S02_2857 [Achromobacter mucicolens]|nr:hypothetical protein [Achromobacter mucicolens]
MRGQFSQHDRAGIFQALHTPRILLSDVIQTQLRMAGRRLTSKIVDVFDRNRNSVQDRQIVGTLFATPQVAGASLIQGIVAVQLSERMNAGVAGVDSVKRSPDQLLGFDGARPQRARHFANGKFPAHNAPLEREMTVWMPERPSLSTTPLIRAR